MTTELLDVVYGAGRGYAALAFGHDGYWSPRSDGQGHRYTHREWTEVRYRWPAGRAELARDVARHAGDWCRVDVYFCPALRRADERKGWGAVDELTTLWADLDGPTADPTLLDWLDPLRGASGSGDNRHLYLPLARPVPLAQHRALNRALATALGADSKWSDEALLRVPGTLNHKHDPPGRVELLPGAPWVWDPVELAGLLGVDLTAARGPTARPAAAAAEPAPAELPPLVRWAWEHPDTLDRSRAHHRLVGACRAAGLSQGQTQTVVAGYGPSVAKYGPRLADEVARCWAKVAPPLITVSPQAVRVPAPRPIAFRPGLGLDPIVAAALEVGLARRAAASGRTTS